MTETAEAALHKIDTRTDKNLVPPASPLSHFRREHCKSCPYLQQCTNNLNHNLELHCILSRIALDLHTLTRNNERRYKHLDW